jgi:iron complex outermembrane recepter protein
VPPGSPPGTGTGQYVIALQDASPSLQPQTADTYSSKCKGMLGKPPVFNAAQLVAFFPQYVVLNPTQAQILAYAAQSSNPQAISQFVGPGATPVYELLDSRTYSLGNTDLTGMDFDVSHTHPTSFGSVDGRVAGDKQITHYTQLSSTAPCSDDLQYGQPVFTMSASVGANIQNLRVLATMNHTSGYNVLRSPALLQDHVSLFSVLKLFFRYQVNGKGLAQDLDFTLNANNVLDQNPPVYRTPAGAAQAGGFANGATVGRLLQLGISKKF